MREDYLLGLSEEGFHRIAYTEWEPERPAKATVIAVHGLTRNSRDFDPLATYLMNQNYHVFCPDVVGRGESDWLKNPLHYTYEQYLADMNALIARAGEDEIAFIGTSMGGIIGMVLASLTNSPIRCLILNDIGPQVPATGIARLASFPHRDEFHSFAEAQHYFKQAYSTFGFLTEDEWHHITEHSIKEIAPNRFVTKIDYRVRMASAKSKIAWSSVLHPLKAMEGILFDVNLWAIWRAIRCPVLLIHGEHSDMLTPDIIRKMQSIHPELTLLEVPNVGHAPPLFASDQHLFICRWLREHY